MNKKEKIYICVYNYLADIIIGTNIQCNVVGLGSLGRYWAGGWYSFSVYTLRIITADKERC